MVSSYTALRTMLTLRYDKSAHATDKGLFVEGLTKDLISPQDLLQYKIECTAQGSWWLIPGHESECIAKQRGRKASQTLPSSYRLFYARIQQRPQIRVVNITTIGPCYLHHSVTNLINYHESAMSSYNCLMLEFGDMYSQEDIRMLLAGVIWQQSEKFENKVKVYFVKTRLQLNTDILHDIANMTFLLMNSKMDEWEETYGLLCSYGEAKAKNPDELYQLLKEYEEMTQSAKREF